VNEPRFRSFPSCRREYGISRFPSRQTATDTAPNIEPAPRFTATDAGGWGGQLVDVDEAYAEELALRRSILAKDRPVACSSRT